VANASSATLIKSIVNLIIKFVLSFSRNIMGNSSSRHRLRRKAGAKLRLFSLTHKHLQENTALKTYF
ncbi:MAG: hypothetical protein MSA22_02555, partial [Prevotella sp.]|nr:hypothetical protein [Prevotella sp.]